MKKILTLALSAVLSVSYLVSSPFAYAETTGSTTASERDIESGYLPSEIVGFKPQFGVLAFNTSATDPDVDDSTTRAAYGATVDFKLNAWESLGYTGLSTGFIFSKIGSPGAGFFGGGGDLDADSHLFLIPANLKLGWNLGEAVRLSIHGGANAMYRSNVLAVRVGEANTDKWNFYPNVGADLEFALGKGIGLIIRPDLMLTPGNDLGMVTAGLNIFG